MNQMCFVNFLLGMPSPMPKLAFLAFVLFLILVATVDADAIVLDETLTK